MSACTTDADCLNGGTCSLLAEPKVCVCAGQFTGDKCETCSLQNADPKTCECLGGFWPVNNECISLQCLDDNDIICNNHGECNNNSCECNYGSTGPLCTLCDTASGYAETPLGCLQTCTTECTLFGYACTPGIIPNQSVCACTKENYDPLQGCKFCIDGFSAVQGQCVNNNCLDDKDIVCNNHGICNDGMCKCSPGAIGPQCNICDVEDGEFVVTKQGCLRVCLKECQGFGYICTPDLESHKSVCLCSQENFSPQQGCQSCMSGFSIVGGQCVAENCISEGDQICNNHGQCIDGVCDCSPGSTGVLCNQCDTASGQYVKTSQGCLMVCEGECRNYNYTCVSGIIPDKSVCLCSKDNFDPQQGCNVCKPGFSNLEGQCVGDNCIDTNNFICNNHGQCIEGACECGPGSTGTYCNRCNTSEGKFVLTQQGCLAVCDSRCRDGYTCTNGIVPKQSVCLCTNANFDPQQFCKHCKKGYFYVDGSCVLDSCISQVGSDDTICSNHGECTGDQCQCRENYLPPLCNKCDSESIKDGNFCLISCNQTNGCMNRFFTCQLIGSKYACACPNENMDPDFNCTQCIKDYKMTAFGCQPEQCVTGHQLCSNNGTCTDGACVCRPEFEGHQCQYCVNGGVLTPQGKCVDQACLDRTTNTECGGHGNCLSMNGNSSCDCEVGYMGRVCERCTADFTQANGECLANSCFMPGKFEPCSNNGMCMSDGTCFCSERASGTYCENCGNDFETLPSGACLSKLCATNGSECNNNGQCIQFGDREPQCACAPGYSGATKCVDCVENWYLVAGECANKQCMGRMSPLPCSGNGTCQEIDFINDIAECFCNTGFVGKFCDQCDSDSGFVHTLDDKCANQVCVGRDGYACSGNGECVAPSEALWECRCSQGASGKFCNDCNEGFLKLQTGHCVFESCVEGGKECNGKGTCRQMGMNHRCICKDGFESESNCVKCLKGYGYVYAVDQCVEGAKDERGDGEKNKSNGGMIAGIVIGVILALVLLGLGVFFLLKKKGIVKVVGKSKNNVPKDLTSAQKFSI